MPSATDHARIVLAAIIPDRRDLLDLALRHLRPEHFPDHTLASLFTMLERYHAVTGSIITAHAVEDLLRQIRTDAGKVALYKETFDLLATARVDEGRFRWSLDQLRELAAERSTGSALTEAMQILTRGAQDTQGNEVRGHAEARAHLLSRFSDIDRALSMQDSPEGDMRVEGDDILGDYASRKAARESARGMGIEFGIPGLDAKINGLQPGELCLIVGWTGDGKTSACVQLAWNACVTQGRNVVILTTETIRAQVRRRLVARHSCLEGFGIPHGGLNSRDLKNGSLSPVAQQQLQEVVTDFTRNPGYGHCYLVQVPRGATVGFCESKLARISQNFSVDLVVMDYLALLKPERKRNSYREELNDTLKEAKQLATTFADGYGVPFVSPWQVNRTARLEAREGFYTAAALSETSEAANSSDIIVSLLAPLDNEDRVTTIKMQVMKNRDGEKANTLEAKIDYATSRFFTDQSAVATPMDALF